MKKRLSFLLAVSILLCGCGKQSANETAETTVSADQTGASAAETMAAETEIVIETTIPETSEIAVENTDTMEQLTSPAFYCTLEIPADWEATSGVSGGSISQEVSIFQPETPNGDSISLAIQETAEDPDTFAALTEDDMMMAYSDTFDTAEIKTFESMTLDGCPGYILVISGETGGISMEMTQLIVNRTDTTHGDYLYMLTYTNASGESTNYTNDLAAHFHLTD